MPFVLQIVGAVGLVGYLSYQSGQRAVEKLADRLIVEIGDRIEQRLKNYLGTAKRVNLTNLAAYESGVLDIKNFNVLGKYFYRQVRLYDFARVNFGGADGSFIGAGYGKNRVPEIAEISPSDPKTVAVYFTDERGNRTGLQERSSTTTNQAARYTDAVRGGKPVWSEIYTRGDFPDRISISASAPVYDNRRRFLGVLGIDLELQQIGEFLKNLDRSDFRRIFIIERATGKLVATSTEESPAPVVGGKARRIAGKESRDPIVREISKALPSSGLQLSRFTVDGENLFVRLVPYRDEYGLDWVTAIAVPEGEFMAEIRRNWRNTLVLCGLTLVGTTGLGILTARRIARSIDRVCRASRLLAAAQWSEPLPEESAIAEIDSLTRSFNTTAEQLREAIDRSRTALEASESKFATVFRSCPDPAWIATLSEGRITDANEKLADFCGYEHHGEIIGKTCTELSLWDDIEDLHRFRETLTRYGRIENFEVIFRDRYGKAKTVLLSATVHRIDGQEYVIGLLKDIGDRIEAERELQRTRHWLDQFSRHSPSIIYTVVAYADGFVRFEYISAACETILEVSPQWVMENGNAFVDMIHPDDRATYREAAERSAERMEDFSHQWREITPSGNIKWLQGKSRPERRENGAIAWYGVVIDITEQKRVERDLQQALNEIENHFENTPLAIGQWGSGDRLLRWSKQAERIFGWTKEEMEGVFWNFIHEDDRPRVRTALNDLILGRVTGVALQNRNYTRDGRVLTCQWYNSAVYDEQGNLLSILSFGQDISDRVAIENDLRRTGQWLDRFSEHSPSQIFTIVRETDGSVHFEYMSAASETINEIPVERVLKDAGALLELHHPDDRSSYFEAVDRSAATMEMFSHQWRIITPSGKLKWLQVKSRPERRENGAIAWYGVAVDITEQKRIERDLQQALQQLETHFENSPLAIFHWATEGRVIRWSRQAEKIFGWTMEDMRTLMWDFVYAEDRERVFEAVAPLLRGEVTGISTRNRNYTKDGRVVTCEWYISAIPDETGNFNSILCFARDITPQVVAEEALRESEERFRRAFEDAGIGVALVALEGNFLRVNRFLQEMLGYSERELQTKTFQEITHPDDLPANLDERQRLLSGQTRTYQIEKRYLHASGAIVRVAVTVSTIADRDGNPAYFVVQVQDIGERYRLDRLKDEFISIVSHELRTPLTAIRGSLGILATGALDHDPGAATNLLEVALRSSERLARLVDDILDLERLESGRVPPTFKECPLGDIVTEAVESVGAIAAADRVAIDVDFPSVSLRGDGDALVRTLTNLLDNAIKFSPPNSTVRLRVRARGRDRNGERSIDEREERFREKFSAPYFLFSISDRGRGIPSDKLESIFGRFQQVDASDARAKGGTGLGLAICRSIIRQHGGDIWVASRFGAGSTFYFTLPDRGSNDETDSDCR